MTEHHLSFEHRVRDNITALRLVMPEVLMRERERAHTKWYAYRFMSPLQATVHFADLYREAFKRYVRTHRDVHDADAAQGLGSRIFGGPSKSLTEVWNARQRADDLGLPYNLLIEFSFYFAGRRTRKRAPRPGQLFDSGEAGIAWPLELEKWIVDPLHLEVQRLSIPQYRNENYRSFPAQREFHDYILASIEERVGAWGPKLAHHCLSRHHLPIRKAIKLVPKGARASAIRHLRGELELSGGLNGEAERLPDIAIAPACFGIPFAVQEASLECLACPLAGLCSEAVRAASDDMHGRYGVLSPLQHSRKRNTNEKTKVRVRNWRAREAMRGFEGSQQPGKILM
ncbi:hypothetical protein [Rhizobium rhizogenes]|uniref:hypothetical protein n=1 Tax=Rhizobium rhizogenes TaxID=359 RepID=UPI001572E520|nr:hypothetical protein [Rhizobium rhizogenes]NTF63421.1 hypothetical protein [Rhizobium rhizogenes]NTG94753.1 hypothetical protein [Rhizobium rhizogenes]